MSLAVGTDNKLYYNSATNASPTWVLICIVGDVNLNLGGSNAEIKTRCSVWDMGLPARLTAELTYNLLGHIGNSVWEALRGYYFGRTSKQIAVANAAIATVGTQYFKAFMHFTAFPIGQNLEDANGGEATMVPSYVEESSALVEPSWNTAS